MRPLVKDIIVALRLFDDDVSVGATHCANRTVYRFELGRKEYTLTIRDLDEADGYERTEVLGLLRTVRAAERVQRWQCPEPTEKEIQGAARKMVPPQRIP